MFRDLVFTCLGLFFLKRFMFITSPYDQVDRGQNLPQPKTTKIPDGEQEFILVLRMIMNGHLKIFNYATD